ncbi:unnamed protein product [Rotaria sp. Silwood2]|nr:unnamed protein product [Rotaria sp. Silwood2]CAF3375685.1 unnamed protein product [Rotaria sp. Silwood2]CAF4410096.1 unnamed protein product [Rotaria sp. Silwood2]
MGASTQLPTESQDKPEPPRVSSTDSKPDVDQASHSTEPADNNNTARSSSNPKHDADSASNSKKTTGTHNTIKTSPKSNHDDYQNAARVNSDHIGSSIIRLTDVDCDNKQLTPIEGYQNSPIITLEEALNPLKDVISRLDEYIHHAKKCAKVDASNILNVDESAAIFLYTMHSDDTSFSRMFNTALRCEDRTDLKSYWFKYLQLIWSALKKLPSVKGHVYQGIATQIKEKYPKKKTNTW